LQAAPRTGLSIQPPSVVATASTPLPPSFPALASVPESDVVVLVRVVPPQAAARADVKANETKNEERAMEAS
jgi:hypothetical protein